MQTWAIWLQVSGLLFELAGIAITVREVRARSRNLAAFDEAQRKKNVSGTISLRGGIEASGLVVVRDREPTLDERVALLEATVKDLPRRMDRTAKEAAERAEHAARRHADDLHKLGGYELDKVKIALREALTGGGLAMLGVGFLVVGLLLQGTGSLLGTACQETDGSGARAVGAMVRMSSG